MDILGFYIYEYLSVSHLISYLLLLLFFFYVELFAYFNNTKNYIYKRSEDKS